MCNEWQNYVQASSEAKDVGRYYTIMGKDGKAAAIQIHPIHTICQQHLKAYIDLCNQFGLSPLSRARVPHQNVESTKSEMEKMLRKSL
jgi:phage terminase small subunit